MVPRKIDALTYRRDYSYHGPQVSSSYGLFNQWDINVITNIDTKSTTRDFGNELYIYSITEERNRAESTNEDESLRYILFRRWGIKTQIIKTLEPGLHSQIYNIYEYDPIVPLTDRPRCSDIPIFSMAKVRKLYLLYKVMSRKNVNGRFKADEFFTQLNTRVTQINQLRDGVLYNKAVDVTLIEYCESEFRQLAYGSDEIKEWHLWTEYILLRTGIIRSPANIIFNEALNIRAKIKVGEILLIDVLLNTAIQLQFERLYFSRTLQDGQRLQHLYDNLKGDNYTNNNNTDRIVGLINHFRLIRFQLMRDISTLNKLNLNPIKDNEQEQLIIERFPSIGMVSKKDTKPRSQLQVLIDDIDRLIHSTSDSTIVTPEISVNLKRFERWFERSKWIDSSGAPFVKAEDKIGQPKKRAKRVGDITAELIASHTDLTKDDDLVDDGNDRDEIDEDDKDEIDVDSVELKYRNSSHSFIANTVGSCFHLALQWVYPFTRTPRKYAEELELWEKQETQKTIEHPATQAQLLQAIKLKKTEIEANEREGNGKEEKEEEKDAVLERLTRKLKATKAKKDKQELKALEKQVDPTYIRKAFPAIERCKALLEEDPWLSKYSGIDAKTIWSTKFNTIIFPEDVGLQQLSQFCQLFLVMLECCRQKQDWYWLHPASPELMNYPFNWNGLITRCIAKLKLTFKKNKKKISRDYVLAFLTYQLQRYIRIPGRSAGMSTDAKARMSSNRDYQYSLVHDILRQLNENVVIKPLEHPRLKFITIWEDKKWVEALRSSVTSNNPEIHSFKLKVDNASQTSGPREKRRVHDTEYTDNKRSRVNSESGSSDESTIMTEESSSSDESTIVPAESVSSDDSAIVPDESSSSDESTIVKRENVDEEEEEEEDLDDTIDVVEMKKAIREQIQHEQIQEDDSHDIQEEPFRNLVLEGLYYIKPGRAKILFDGILGELDYMNKVAIWGQGEYIKRRLTMLITRHNTLLELWNDEIEWAKQVSLERSKVKLQRLQEAKIVYNLETPNLFIAETNTLQLNANWSNHMLDTELNWVTYAHETFRQLEQWIVINFPNAQRILTQSKQRSDALLSKGTGDGDAQLALVETITEQRAASLQSLDWVNSDTLGTTHFERWNLELISIVTTYDQYEANYEKYRINEQKEEFATVADQDEWVKGTFTSKEYDEYVYLHDALPLLLDVQRYYNGLLRWGEVNLLFFSTRRWWLLSEGELQSLKVSPREMKNIVNQAYFLDEFQIEKRLKSLTLNNLCQHLARHLRELQIQTIQTNQTMEYYFTTFHDELLIIPDIDSNEIDSMFTDMENLILVYIRLQIHAYLETELGYLSQRILRLKRTWKIRFNQNGVLDLSEWKIPEWFSDIEGLDEYEDEFALNIFDVLTEQQATMHTIFDHVNHKNKDLYLLLKNPYDKFRDKVGDEGESDDEKKALDGDDLGEIMPDAETEKPEQREIGIRKLNQSVERYYRYYNHMKSYQAADFLLGGYRFPLNNETVGNLVSYYMGNVDSARGIEFESSIEGRREIHPSTNPSGLLHFSMYAILSKVLVNLRAGMTSKEGGNDLFDLVKTIPTNYDFLQWTWLSIRYALTYVKYPETYLSGKTKKLIKIVTKHCKKLSELVKVRTNIIDPIPPILDTDIIVDLDYGEDEIDLDTEIPFSHALLAEDQTLEREDEAIVRDGDVNEEDEDLEEDEEEETKTSHNMVRYHYHYPTIYQTYNDCILALRKGKEFALLMKSIPLLRILSLEMMNNCQLLLNSLRQCERTMARLLLNGCDQPSAWSVLIVTWRYLYDDFLLTRIYPFLRHIVRDGDKVRTVPMNLNLCIDMTSNKTQRIWFNNVAKQLSLLLFEPLPSTRLTKQLTPVINSDSLRHLSTRLKQRALRGNNEQDESPFTHHSRDDIIRRVDGIIYLMKDEKGQVPRVYFQMLLFLFYSIIS